MPSMKFELSLSDVLFLVGAVLMLLGFALWSIPLALVVVGASCVGLGLWSHLATTRPASEDTAGAQDRGDGGSDSSSSP